MCVCVCVCVCVCALLAKNAHPLPYIFIFNLAVSAASGGVAFDDFHPRDKRLYFEFCNGCGIDSHLFYFIFVVSLYGAWILLVLFVLVVRCCFSQSIVKYHELGYLLY